MADNNKIPNWLASFFSSIRCSNSFLQEMNIQLGKQFFSMTGFDLEENFQLLKPFPDSFSIFDDNMVCYIKGDLVGSRMGFQIEIAWESTSEHRLISPTEEVVNNEIQFWWSYLPVSEIIESEGGKNKVYLNTTDMQFPIDIKITILPHLCLEITLEDIIKENRVEYFQNLFLTAQDEWNSRERNNNGIIHSIGELTLISEKIFCIKIDFGSAGIVGLEYILNMINRIEDKVLHISIYSY